MTPNFTWLWLSCWRYYFEAIKRLQNSLFFRRVKLDHWSLFGLVTWVQTIGLRVWNSRWRPLLICLLITLSLKGLTQIHHACFLSMYFLLLSSISICRVEMIHWKYFQSVAFLSWRSWWLKPWHGLQKDDLMIFVFYCLTLQDHIMYIQRIDVFISIFIALIRSSYEKQYILYNTGTTWRHTI